jgi:mannose-6-phosphate isomerase-like protein (cupin superfamily)
MLRNTNLLILNRDILPNDGKTFEFEGQKYDETEVSFIWVDMEPGGGVRLHQHAYKEVFIIQEGTATFTVGAAALEAHAGQIIIVPPNTPHKFKNTGNQRLRQVDIHISPQFITQWLEE